MADVELDVTFESSNVNLSTDFGTIYAVDDGVAVKIIANPYSSESTYEIGAYVIYNKLLYRCIVAVDVGEEFDPEKWSNIKLADDTKNKADTTYVDTELNKKADKNDTYTKTQVDTIANGKANASDVYDKTYIDNELTGVNDALATKMDKNNPTGTGSFSLNRKSGTTVGFDSVAMGGRFPEASGDYSIALGDNAMARGENSFSVGKARSEGRYSVAIGNGVIAQGDNQIVIGKNNIVDTENKYVEIVGNGLYSLVGMLSNARTLDWQGNETLAGDLTYNGNKSLTSEISRLDGRITDLPEAMVFKGTLGIGGTVETLPTASAENEGWTFKCITAGTYAGLTLKVGDSVTCFNPPNTSVYEWDISGNGDTDTDTWRAIKVNGTEELGSGISSGSVDFVGSENIDVEFDSNGNKIGIKTKNIYTKEEVDDIVYDILPDDTASGSVANFATSLELPLKSLEVDVNAVQSAGTPTPASPLPIEGWSEMKIARTGKNLFDNQFPNISTSAKYRQIKVKNGTYIASTDCPRNSDSQANLWVLEGYKTSGASTALNGLWEGREIALTITDGYITVAYREREEIANPANHRTQIELGSEVTDYEPYVGNEYIINLGGTYYGGHFTQDKDGHRQFEVTHNYFDIGSTTWNSSADGYTQNKVDITDMKPAPSGNTKANFLCSSYKTDSPYNVYNKVENGTIAIAINQRLRVYDTRLTGMTGQQVQDALTGIYIAYEMVTPIVIDLPDGEPIITINGTNNIYADTGDTSVVFKDSVNGYVDKKIASVQALALNT